MTCEDCARRREKIAKLWARAVASYDAILGRKPVQPPVIQDLPDTVTSYELPDPIQQEDDQ